MHPALARTDHRPWPLPAGPWSWRQTWRDLLFAHWPVPRAALEPLVPSGIQLQEWSGSAWLGVVPFRMTGVAKRPLPDLPWISAFPELNVRTYVERDGRPGVWFLSLDAGNLLAVHAARRLFHLPYFHARIDCEEEGGAIRYRSVRRGPEKLTFEAAYHPVSDAREAAAGTLERWLTERYCLYARSPDGRILRTEVHHRPWPLQAAKARIDRNDLLTPHGLTAPRGPPHLLFSRRLDVVVWSPRAIPGGRP